MFGCRPTSVLKAEFIALPHSLEAPMKTVSDRGESKGLVTYLFMMGFIFGMLAVFEHLSGLQNHWAGSW